MTAKSNNSSGQNNSTIKETAVTTFTSTSSAFTFSQKSLKLLNTVDKRLSILANEVLRISKVDFAITEGYRDLETQQKYFKESKSKCDGIVNKSKHQEGEAIDIACYIPFKRMSKEEQKKIVEIFGKSGGITGKDYKITTEDKAINEVKTHSETLAERKDIKTSTNRKIDETKSYITWDRKYYYYIAGLFEAKAKEMRDRQDLNQNQNLDIDIQWGGWFNGFEDCVHFELR